MTTHDGPATDQIARDLLEDLQIRGAHERPDDPQLLHSPEIEDS
ncbi:hypothetical protein [Mycobacterium sp. RTGN5]|nr:hypothetical protein [Mycobacterium sp. RTGN5]